MKKSRAKQRGTSNSFEVFRVSIRRPSCLAGYFTWPQVALTHHAFHGAYTLREQGVSSYSGRTVGAALRGRPRLENGSNESEAVVFWRRVQTEGGHGGPPLQFVPRCSIMGSAPSKVSCFFRHDDIAFQIDRLL